MSSTTLPAVRAYQRKGKASGSTKSPSVAAPKKRMRALIMKDVSPSKRDAVKAYMERDSKYLIYQRAEGVDAYVLQVTSASPLDIIEIERTGVDGSFLKDLSKRMDLPASRIFGMLGVPRATGEGKAAKGELLTGSGGQAAVGVIKLLGIAQEIVRNSTADGAKDFDAARWLGQWIERPQPALGGRKPADLIDTRTGVEVVARLLGSIESGAYQ